VKTIRSTLLILGFAICAGAWAHHSAAAYDLMHTVKQSGTLTEFDYENPHVRFLLEVKGSGGASTTWQVEGPPPGWFRRAGIRKADFAKGVGAPVTLEIHPAKDGSPTGFFQMITFADGTYIRFSDVLQ